MLNSAKPYNSGSGYAVSIKEVVDIVVTALGSEQTRRRRSSPDPPEGFGSTPVAGRCIKVQNRRHTGAPVQTSKAD